ncbi:pentatricopeptide repeat-containing protein At5g27460-like [Phoenix dactylifera]|uniref:Pentatricopeptide repeat-containing protein At5g27460 n=1 Tax=Phoenix dactylifera TaxID=42345 RepID=A0A8B8ZFL4_PHODC|nr:pentatricopeptide repeat-containing protein At5g27460 [Phoenix dactylifera]XP_038972931.1 pentatricopeptide repeat-containing protein At5g27460-like [Phoenix dactylifera]
MVRSAPPFLIHFAPLRSEMATGSLWAALLRRARDGNPMAPYLRAVPFARFESLRPFSSGHSRGEAVAVEEERAARLDDLRSRLFRLRFPKRSATAALDKWVGEGRKVTASDLRQIAKDLKRSQRYKHALEILTWMDSWDNFQPSSADHAARLEMITKVHSIAEAELYFEKLSDSASRRVASFPLLHHYVKERNLEKAEALMSMLLNLGLVVDPHPFNEMMKLYVATGQYKKVLAVIQHMKRCKIPRNVLSYNLWLNASGELSGVAVVEMVHEEMMNDKNVEVGWSTYSTLANIYTKSGLLDKAFAALRTAEERLSVRKRLGYSFLMTNYAALKDRDGILRLWESSKRVPGRISCANYMSVMLCLIKVGDIQEAEKVFKTWEMECRKYDVRVSNVLLGAYMRNGWMDRAEALHLYTLEEGACPNYKTWEILMEGWVKCNQMDKAVEAMKKGFSMLKACNWRPRSDIVVAIAKYFEEQGNIQETERYVKVLRHLRLMSLPIYKSYLRACINAKRAAPSMLEKMARDGISLDAEAEELIQRVSKLDNISAYNDFYLW